MSPYAPLIVALVGLALTVATIAVSVVIVTRRDDARLHQEVR